MKRSYIVLRLIATVGITFLLPFFVASDLLRNLWVCGKQAFRWTWASYCRRDRQVEDLFDELWAAFWRAGA